MIDVRRDGGIAHIVALSGGKDSTAMALRLAEMNPDISYNYVCTPTFDELPEMWEHWRKLTELLGAPILPVNTEKFSAMCDKQKALPNWRMRFCTRILKIAPIKTFYAQHAPAVAYVGLRADEPGRVGIDGRGGDLNLTAGGVEQRYPLREWGWGINDVWRYLEQRDVQIPERTDCARCFFQTLGEWYQLWQRHPEIYADAEAQEERFGATFRSPQRDTWPADLKGLRVEFEAGRVPRGTDGQLDLFRRSTCRVCTL